MNCWADLLTSYVGLLCKNKKQKGSMGLARCLSQFFLGKENINCLGNEFSVRTSDRLSDLIFIIDDHDNFSSWMMIRIFLPLGERFSFLIVNRLIRDN